MSALQTAAHRWRTDSEMPEGITVTPVDIESGHAVSSHSGRVHIVTEPPQSHMATADRLRAARETS